MSFRSRTFMVALLLALAFLGVGHAEAATQQVHVSKNWAGFAALGDSYTGVRATWVVPESRAVGRTASADAAWIGIGGSQTKDLIQAGTQTIFIDGKPQYVAWYETLPDAQRSLPVAVKPGDTVTVSLKETAAGIWHLSFTNVTTGASYAADIPYLSSHSSVEWIVERPLAITNKGMTYLSLTDFDTLTFTDATAIVNGIEVPLQDLGAHPIIMMPSSSSVSAAPGSLSNSSFTLSYLTQSEGRRYLNAFKKVYRSRSTLPQQVQAPAQTTLPADGTFIIRIFF